LAVDVRAFYFRLTTNRGLLGHLGVHYEGGQSPVSLDKHGSVASVQLLEDLDHSFSGVVVFVDLVGATEFGLGPPSPDSEVLPTKKPEVSSQ